MTKEKQEVLDLTVVLTGKIVESNLPAFKKKALAVIKAADRPLITTKDFEDAAVTSKKCKESEEALVIAKKKALDQTVDIKALFDTMDEISAELRKTRLSLDKKVKRRKVEIRNGIIDSAYGKFNDAFEAVAKNTPEVRNSTKVNRALFEDAVSGKSSIENMEKAVDAVLNGEMHILDKRKTIIQGNKELIAECEYKSLFPDASTLVCKTSTEVQLIIDARVSKHILEEKERKEKAEAAAKVKADRKAKEEEDKKQAEAKARELASQQKEEVVPVESIQAPTTTNVGTGSSFGSTASSDARTPIQGKVEPFVEQTENQSNEYIMTVNLKCPLHEAKTLWRELLGFKIVTKVGLTEG